MAWIHALFFLSECTLMCIHPSILYGEIQSAQSFTFKNKFYILYQTRLHLQGKVARRAMPSKNEEIQTLP